MRPGPCNGTSMICSRRQFYQGRCLFMKRIPAVFTAILFLFASSIFSYCSRRNGRSDDPPHQRLPRQPPSQARQGRQAGNGGHGLDREDGHGGAGEKPGRDAPAFRGGHVPGDPHLESLPGQARYRDHEPDGVRRHDPGQPRVRLGDGGLRRSAKSGGLSFPVGQHRRRKRGAPAGGQALRHRPAKGPEGGRHRHYDARDALRHETGESQGVQGDPRREGAPGAH